MSPFLSCVLLLTSNGLNLPTRVELLKGHTSLGHSVQWISVNGYRADFAADR